MINRPGPPPAKQGEKPQPSPTDATGPGAPAWATQIRLRQSRIIGAPTSRLPGRLQEFMARPTDTGDADTGFGQYLPAGPVTVQAR